MKFIIKCITALALLVMTSSCATTTSRVNDTPGQATTYEDLNTPGQVQGVGVESQDIASMTDKMMRDMLSTAALTGRQIAPYIIVDDAYFTNESSSIIDKSLITERLMVNLNRAAQGRMMFVERAAAEMVEKERLLKRQGVVSPGTMGQTQMTAGADFRLTGKIMSLDSVDPASGKVARYHQITFKMVDMETSTLVWSGMYEFKKSSQNDIVYR